MIYVYSVWSRVRTASPHTHFAAHTTDANRVRCVAQLSAYVDQTEYRSCPHSLCARKVSLQILLHLYSIIVDHQLATPATIFGPPTTVNRIKTTIDGELHRHLPESVLREIYQIRDVPFDYARSGFESDCASTTANFSRPRAAKRKSKSRLGPTLEVGPASSAAGGGYQSEVEVRKVCRFDAALSFSSVISTENVDQLKIENILIAQAPLSARGYHSEDEGRSRRVHRQDTTLDILGSIENVTNREQPRPAAIKVRWPSELNWNLCICWVWLKVITAFARCPEADRLTVALNRSRSCAAPSHQPRRRWRHVTLYRSTVGQSPFDPRHRNQSGAPVHPRHDQSATLEMEIIRSRMGLHRHLCDRHPLPIGRPLLTMLR